MRGPLGGVIEFEEEEEVAIILKKDQRTGKLTYGIVEDLLTSAAYHSRGIKVRLKDGQVGRVAETDVGDPDES